jgi:hypothetical protein
MARRVRVDHDGRFQVLRLLEEHDVKLLRVLTDLGSEFCDNPERHEYELYLAIEDTDHSRTKTKSYCVPQKGVSFNQRAEGRSSHIRGRWCFGKTSMQPFLDKMIAA